MTIGEALDQYVAKLGALERTVAALSNQVFRLEGGLAEIKRLVIKRLVSHPPAVPLRPSDLRITQPSVASQIRAAVDPSYEGSQHLQAAIDRVASVIDQVPEVADLAGIDLNAEFPEGSAVLMSGDFEKDSKAAPAYGLLSSKGVINPLDPSKACTVRGECSLKVVDLDYGDTCPQAVTRCMFNKAHK